jgi:hypothetical protein
MRSPSFLMMISIQDKSNSKLSLPSSTKLSKSISEKEKNDTSIGSLPDIIDSFSSADLPLYIFLTSELPFCWIACHEVLSNS